MECPQSGNHNCVRISGKLRDIIWKNRYMLKEGKIKIHKGLIKPADLCSGEAGRYHSN